MRFRILGSGSSGNAALLVTDGARVLVDAGFSAKKLTALLADGLVKLGAKVNAEPVFDTLTVSNVGAERVHAAAAAKRETFIEAYNRNFACMCQRRVRVE